MKIKLRTTFLGLDSWEDAFVQIDDAKHWRNLVYNPRFEHATSTRGWITTSGAVAVGSSTSLNLGGNNGNKYVTGDGAALGFVIEQSNIGCKRYYGYGTGIRLRHDWHALRVRAQPADRRR